MNIAQKIIALDILQNAGAIATERGRKAAILEIMGHGALAVRLVQAGDRIDFELAEIARLSAGQPLWPEIPERYQPPAALAKAEELLAEKQADMRAIAAEIQQIAEALEADIDAIDRTAIARWQEGNMPA